MTVKRITVEAPVRAVRLLIYGDSITEPEGYYPTSLFPQAWTQLIIKELDGNAISSGRGGYTINEVRNYIANELPYIKAKYVMVTIGTNGGKQAVYESFQLLINPGDEVSVIVTSGVITEVNLKKSASPTSDKLSAEILAVDPTNRVLTVLKEGKLTYINCKKAASILNSETGKTLSFSALAAGDMIVAYGSYTDSTNFAATSIVIELKH